MNLPILLVSQNQKQREDEIAKILGQFDLRIDHPDLLYLSEKLGIEAIKKIKEHLNWRPVLSKKRTVVINPADSLTPDGQNSLLKILEEPSDNALIIMGVESEDVLLETVRSRIEIRYLQDLQINEKNDFRQIADLLALSVPERLESIEKNEDRKKLIADLVGFFYQRMPENIISAGELKLLIAAETWIKQNVSAKAVSDFLMIKFTKVGK